MGWFGKLTFGILGLLFGGPLGAIAGAAMGHILVDKIDSFPSYETPPEARNSFLESKLCLSFQSERYFRVKLRLHFQTLLRGQARKFRGASLSSRELGASLCWECKIAVF